MAEPEDFGRVCGHCARICGNDAGGLGTVEGVSVCHPNEVNRPDCYRQVVAFGHRLRDCPKCRVDDRAMATFREMTVAIGPGEKLTSATARKVVDDVEAKALSDVVQRLRDLDGYDDWCSDNQRYLGRAVDYADWLASTAALSAPERAEQGLARVEGHPKDTEREHTCHDEFGEDGCLACADERNTATPREPRVWAMQTIPADVMRVRDGREEPTMWFRYGLHRDWWATGAGELDPRCGADLIRDRGPLTEVVDA